MPAPEPIPYAVRLLRQRVAGPGAPVFDLCARYGERVFRLFQIYLWAGAHLHRDGGLEAYRAVFQKARGRPSTGLGVRTPR